MKILKRWVCIGLLLVFSGPSWADQPEPPQIVVEGEAEVLLEPDYIEWVVDIRTRNKVPKIAREVNDSIFESLLDIAGKADIDEKEMAWGEPAYEQKFSGGGSETPQIDQYTGTEVYRRVTLTMRDMDEFDEMLDAVHPLGVFYAVRRKSTQTAKTARRVKVEALKDARMKAIEAAAALGQNIGKAIDVEVSRHPILKDQGGLFGYPALFEYDDTSAGPDGKIRVTAYAKVSFRLE